MPNPSPVILMHATMPYRLHPHSSYINRATVPRVISGYNSEVVLANAKVTTEHGSGMATSVAH